MPSFHPTPASPPDAAGRGLSRGGFTLLELLLAIAILSMVMTVTFLTFNTAVTAWRRGIALTDNLHHGDYVMDQLVMALRSAYFADTVARTTSCGFQLEDDGDGENGSDTISWVKLGTAMVGESCPFTESPHRVLFYVGEGEDGKPSAMVKAWRLFGQDEEFDPEEDVKPLLLSRRVLGFNCRTADPDQTEKDKEIEWLDDWENSNAIPTIVELTLFLQPMDEGGDPVIVQRVVGIPVAALSLSSTVRRVSSDETGESGADAAATNAVPSIVAPSSSPPPTSPRSGGAPSPTGGTPPLPAVPPLPSGVPGGGIPSP